MRKRAMSSAVASRKKIEGHAREDVFAARIGGSVMKHGPRKKDVVGPAPDFVTYSVKGGAFWQVFLYSEARLRTNTILQGLGDIASLMVACLDAFPPTFAQYQADKADAKQRLQVPMILLMRALQPKSMLAAFLEKSLFNGGEVDALALTPDGDSNFYIFSNDDVVRVLTENVEVTNSIAMRRTDTPNQKVLLKYNGINLGEIEVRNDSVTHYREMKFRIQAQRAFPLLMKYLSPQVVQ